MFYASLGNGSQWALREGHCLLYLGRGTQSGCYRQFMRSGSYSLPVTAAAKWFLDRQLGT